jgi:hypothetical protein
MKAQKVKVLRTPYVLLSVVSGFPFFLFLHDMHEMSTKLGHHIYMSACHITKAFQMEFEFGIVVLHYDV